MKKKEEVYMQYVCANAKLKRKDPKYCNRGWIDLDVTGRITPQKWKYCQDCCEKYGYINPKEPPKKKLSKKQKEVLERNKFKSTNNLNVGINKIGERKYD